MITLTSKKKPSVYYRNSNAINMEYYNKRINIIKQRIAGILLFLASILVMAAIGEITAAFIILPLSLYVIFTKKQVLDFNVFPSISKRKLNTKPDMVRQASDKNSYKYICHYLGS